jgi:hypothetical protein
VLATGFIFNGIGGIVLDDQAVYVVAVVLTAVELVSGSDGSGNARSKVYSVAKLGGTPVPSRAGLPPWTGREECIGCPYQAPGRLRGRQQPRRSCGPTPTEPRGVSQP